MPWPAPWTSTSPATRWARAPTASPSTLADLWPTAEEVTEAIRASLTSDMFRQRYGAVFDGDDRWQAVETATGDTFDWDPDSTYVLRPPFLEDLSMAPAPTTDVVAARVLAKLGDSVTTDHISPAGNISPSTPAGHYLSGHGVERADFNSYGTRRGNHEVMVRGTFANVRLRNQLAPGTEGGFTIHLPEGEETTIYDAATRYADEGIPLVVLAGKEYGSGSSRDWAAKGTALLGIRAVIAESYERIHRSNLIGMGVLPLQYVDGQNASSLALGGHEVFSITGLESLNEGAVPKTVAVRAVDGRPGGGLRGSGADRYADGGRVLPPRGDPALHAASDGRLSLGRFRWSACGPVEHRQMAARRSRPPVSRGGAPRPRPRPRGWKGSRRARRIGGVPGARPSPPRPAADRPA